MANREVLLMGFVRMHTIVRQGKGVYLVCVVFVCRMKIAEVKSFAFYSSACKRLILQSSDEDLLIAVSGGG